MANTHETKRRIRGVVYDLNEREIETDWGKKNKWSVAMDENRDTWVSGFGAVPKEVKDAFLNQTPISVLVVEHVGKKGGIFLNYDSMLIEDTTVPASTLPQKPIQAELTLDDRIKKAGETLAAAKKAFELGMGRPYLGPAGTEGSTQEISTINMLYMDFAGTRRR